MSLQMTGLRAWFLQRVSAVYIGLFAIYLVIHFAGDAPGSYEQWRAWLHRPAVTVSWALFFAALLLHAWVGVRDVVLDYVHHTALRLVVLVVVALFLIVQGLWALVVLFGAGT